MQTLVPHSRLTPDKGLLKNPFSLGLTTAFIVVSIVGVAYHATRIGKAKRPGRMVCGPYR